MLPHLPMSQTCGGTQAQVSPICTVREIAAIVNTQLRQLASNHYLELMGFGNSTEGSVTGCPMLSSRPSSK